MDDDTRRAAERLDRLAEGIKVSAAVLAGLLLAFAASMALLYVYLVLLWQHWGGAD